jgi:dihydroorotate dehydrogenase
LDQGIINWYGFNSDGADVVLDRLEKLRSEGELQEALIVNLGKNETAEAIPDYVYEVKKFNDVADMMAVNISTEGSPMGKRFHRESSE